MTPTPQQAEYVQFLLNGTDHTALRARAGTGKTSTIMLGVAAIAKSQPRAEVMVCAYNKAIADEVGGKLKAAGYDWRQVQATTVHSMGFGLLKFIFKPTVEQKKVRLLIEARNEAVYQQYGAQIEALVRYAKQAGVGFFNDLPIGNVAVWHELADHFDVNGLDDTSDADMVVEAAQSIYRASLAQTDVCDFDDMVLFPLIKNLRVKFTKDHIFFDEAQDASRARQALVRKFLKPGTGRLHIVGDDRQAIYGFSGADAAALPRLIADMGARVFPLNVTWRCPKAVVALAQTLVPDIQAAPSAPDGIVRHVMEGQETVALLADLGPGDAVLCRNMAPLVSLAMKLIRSGKACKVEGRSIGDGLIAMAKRWKVKTIEAFFNRLDAYQDREMQKAMAKGNENKMQEVEDRCETMREIARACVAAGKTQVSDIIDFINNLFADGETNVIVMATAHRSKGREWPRVVLWGNNLYSPSRFAKQPWQVEQEANLQYVMYTRAQKELIFVHLS